VDKGSYPSFAGSPASEGLLQCDLWNSDPVSTDLDWQGLRQKVQKGLRNSLSIALMPTASTSQILGNNECFEPYTTNMYVRRTLSGEFTIVNHHLLNDLMAHGLWSTDMKNLIVAHNGSIQNIPNIPDGDEYSAPLHWSGILGHDYCYVDSRDIAFSKSIE
jgi:ribonucleotide reductase alpha subunit